LDDGKSSEKVFLVLTSKLLEIFQVVEGDNGKERYLPYVLVNLN
jgi:hypothetical protein